LVVSSIEDDSTGVTVTDVVLVIVAAINAIVVLAVVVIATEKKCKLLQCRSACIICIAIFCDTISSVKMDIGHPVSSKSKFRTLVKLNLGRRTSR
jgi:hypothetical protein